MTKLQRARVAELLRCAADLFVTGRNKNQPTREAARRDYKHIGDDAAYSRAWSALYSLNAVEWNEHFEDRLLEAAARVEEGTWP